MHRMNKANKAKSKAREVQYRVKDPFWEHRTTQ